MAIHKTEGIILTSANWSESSQTITLFTPDRGKITLNVKGSRQLAGKRGRPLRFARLEFSCYLRAGSETGYLSDVEPVEVFLFEKDGQLGRLAFASAAVELLNSLLIAHDPQPSCYQITLSFLRMTDQLDKNRLPGLFAGYILRLISLLGFRPNLAGCGLCGRSMSAENESENSPPLMFSAERGAIICDDCRRSLVQNDELLPLPTALHSRALRLMESSLEEASQIHISLKDLNLLIDIITSLLRYHAGTTRPTKSLDFLDKLARAAKTYGG